MLNKTWIWAFLFLFAWVLPSSAQTNIASLRVDTTPVKSTKELFSSSTLIVYGWPDSADQQYPTGNKVEQFEIVNFVQTLHVKKTLKGTAPRLVHILTTGTNPLPPPSSPLNERYPGPLAEGDYVCFLKKIPGTDLYTFVGGWQGVYPVFFGKTVTLQGYGFPELNQITIKKLEEIIAASRR